MSAWNYADVWEAVADVLPDAPALIHGDRTRTWREFDRRADNVGRWLLGAGVAHQDKVALYLYNCSEYLEATFAAYKVGLVPINTNYRYADDELRLPVGERRRRGRGLPRDVRRPHRGDPPTACPGSAAGCGSTTARPLPAVGDALRGGRRAAGAAPAGRAGTGAVGTRSRRPPPALHRGHHRHAQGRHVAPGRSLRPAERRWVPALRRGGRHRRRPGGGRAERSGDDPAARLPADARHRRVHRHGVPERGRPGGHPHLAAVRSRRAARHRRARRSTVSIIVGDAFARPILAALDAAPGAVGPVEPGGGRLLGRDVVRGDQTGPARPPPGNAPDRRLLVLRGHRHGRVGVVGPDGGPHRAVPPGSRGPGDRRRRPDVEPGSGAGRGAGPRGARSHSATTRTRPRRPPPSGTIDGVRYSVPGDYAGSTPTAASNCSAAVRCASTPGREGLPRGGRGGRQDGDRRRDAVVVGIPTPGSARRSSPSSSCGPEVADGSVSPDTVIERVKARLAGYKAPREVQFVETIGRSPSGKVDYATPPGVGRVAGASLGLTAPTSGPGPAAAGRRHGLLAPCRRTKSLTT